MKFNFLNRFKNLKTRTKLFLGFGWMLVLVFIIAYVGFDGLWDYHHQNRRLILITESNDALSDSHIDVLNLINNRDTTLYANIIAEIDTALEKNNEYKLIVNKNNIERIESRIESINDYKNLIINIYLI